jgi:uncharacterized protein YndB with AHSA1/START domain
MTERSVTHATFVIERSFDAAPARVYRAFADPREKAKWFGGAEDKYVETRREEDFRVGGKDRMTGKWHNGPESDFQAIYQDIIPDQRIVYTYDMHLDGKRISVSLATIEFKPDGKGTRLVLTEQGAYLDGWDNPAQREAGTRGLLDALAKSLGE